LETFLIDVKSRFEQTKKKAQGTFFIPEIWISPNIRQQEPLKPQWDPTSGIVDSFRELFKAGAQWQSVKSKTNVFTFFLNAIKNTPSSLMRQVVSILEEASISIAVEVVPINYGTGCLGKDAAEMDLKTLNLITKAGGEIAHLALADPPFEVAQHKFATEQKTCELDHSNVEEVIRYVIGYIKAVRKVYPEVKIGQIDAVPFFTVEKYSANKRLPTMGDLPRILDYEFSELKAIGEKMDWFHADNPYDIAIEHPTGWDKLKALEDFVKSRGVKFGLIYNTQRGGESSDELFFKETMASLISYAEAGGNPDHMDIRSWYPHPTHLIPESQPYTFTYLIKKFLEILEDS